MGQRIGIDFGTTNTVVSYYDKKGRLRQLLYQHNHITPTVIYYKNKSEWEIGDKAAQLLYLHKNEGIFGKANFKLSMGSNERYDLATEAGESLKPKARELARDFLNKLINGIEDKLIKDFGPVEGTIENAVVTVPAAFQDKERKWTRWAAEKAGIPQVKLVPEPTAAAVAYQEGHPGNDGQVVLVYDFGGGTFDVSIIRKEQGHFVEKARGGRKDLGGNTLTNKIFAQIWERVNEKYGLDLPLDEDEFYEDEGFSQQEYRSNRYELWNGANKLKKDLSMQDAASAQVNIYTKPGYNEMCEISFTRQEFENLIADGVDQTVATTLQTIDEAKSKGIDQIDDFVLAGGSSQIPLVREKLQQALENQEIQATEDVTTLISRGAAILAKEYQAIDSLTEPLTSVEYGIILVDGVQYQKFQPILAADVKLPCQNSHDFSLFQDNQQHLEINYYTRDIKNYPQATRLGDTGIELVDTLIINDLPQGLKKDDTLVNVTFKLARDGILTISAVLTDRSGQVIRQGSMNYQKQSDLE